MTQVDPYQLDATTCTHGPDAEPAGLKVRRDVTPVTARSPEPTAPRRESADVPPDAEIVRDQGGTALSPNAPALIPLLKRWSDCREAHTTDGICYEDHDELITWTDQAIAREDHQP